MKNYTDNERLKEHLILKHWFAKDINLLDMVSTLDKEIDQLKEKIWILKKK